MKGLDIVLAHSMMTMNFLSLNTVENSTILHQLIDVAAFATKIGFPVFVTVKGLSWNKNHFDAYITYTILTA